MNVAVSAESMIPAMGQRKVRQHGRSDDPSVAVCTLATGSHRELIRHTVPTLDAAARRHGWTIVVSCEELGQGRPASWAKLRLVGELLSDHDYVFWVDADALIVDLNRNVVDEVTQDADIWFATHRSHDMEFGVLNAGVFLARQSAFVFELIEAMWACEEFIDHNWWENAALLHLLGYSLVPPFERLHESSWSGRIGDLGADWNSVPGYCEQPTPALNHHARADHDDFAQRVEALRIDLQMVRRRFPADFNPPGRWKGMLDRFRS